jgi:hypothetical protein
LGLYGDSMASVSRKAPLQQLPPKPKPLPERLEVMIW